MSTSSQKVSANQIPRKRAQADHVHGGYEIQDVLSVVIQHAQDCTR